MAATKEASKLLFKTKVPALIAELKDWFEEETAAIDGSVEAAAPSGSGGSLMGMRPVIDSKRVVDATVVTKKVLEIELPPHYQSRGLRQLRRDDR